MTVLLSPHLDDAVLSAWTRLGPETHVVNVFTGPPEKTDSLSLWDKVCGFTDSTDVAMRRLREDSIAMLHCGVERVTSLGLRDRLVRAADGAPDPTLYEVREGIVEALGESRDVLAPLGGGPRAHPDHVLVRDAARLLAREGAISLTLYADQPYVYKSRTWPMFVAERAPSASTDTVEASWWSRFPRAIPEMVSLTEGLRVRALSDDDRARKLAAMKLYETQYENLNSRLRTKGLLAEDAADLWGVEVFWEIS